MSHNVTVTRTTTTVTTTSAILLNTGYLKTTSGILKVLQLVGFFMPSGKQQQFSCRYTEFFAFSKELVVRRPSALVSALEIASAKHIVIPYYIYSPEPKSLLDILLHDWLFGEDLKIFEKGPSIALFFQAAIDFVVLIAFVPTDYWVRHHRTGWPLLFFLLQPIVFY